MCFADDLLRSITEFVDLLGSRNGIKGDVRVECWKSRFSGYDDIQVFEGTHSRLEFYFHVC